MPYNLRSAAKKRKQTERTASPSPEAPTVALDDVPQPVEHVGRKRRKRSKKVASNSDDAGRNHSVGMQNL